jgi:hypothetical protein
MASVIKSSDRIEVFTDPSARKLEDELPDHISADDYIYITNTPEEKKLVRKIDLVSAMRNFRARDHRALRLTHAHHPLSACSLFCEYRDVPTTLPHVADEPKLKLGHVCAQ